MDSNKTIIPVYIYLPDLQDVKFEVKVCLLPDSVFKEKQQKINNLQEHGQEQEK